ncbi:helix-turn-helix domain-containing protein [Rhodococcus sp. NPDC003318]|uniref:helix-turn-helix domain-containing protein n=1 Tax=Rhodococcus sp. NPDC003318 TaxID=3364503 RepID=UPI0036A3EC3E
MRGFDPHRLVAARVQAGMERGDLARLADISVATLSRWETGARSPQIDVLARVARALEIEIAALVSIPKDDRFPGDWRILIGMTQPELGARAGVSTAMVGSIERGEARLTDEVATKLSSALGISPDDLRAAHRRARNREAGTPA